MSGNWTRHPSTDGRLYNKARKVERGDLEGKVHRSTPVTPIDLQRYPNVAAMEIYVQPDEPSTTTIGALWFDTDEPV